MSQLKITQSFLNALAQVHKPVITEEDDLVHVHGYGRVKPHQVHAGAAHHMSEMAKHHAAGNHLAAAHSAEMASTFLRAAHAHKQAQEAKGVHEETVSEAMRSSYEYKNYKHEGGIEGWKKRVKEVHPTAKFHERPHHSNPEYNKTHAHSDERAEVGGYHHGTHDSYVFKGHVDVKEETLTDPTAIVEVKEVDPEMGRVASKFKRNLRRGDKKRDKEKQERKDDK